MPTVAVVLLIEGEKSLLCANTQSGGEKSVSTTFFLWSLQRCSKASFWVIDEGNQGRYRRHGDGDG